MVRLADGERKEEKVRKREVVKA